MFCGHKTTQGPCQAKNKYFARQSKPKYLSNFKKISNEYTLSRLLRLLMTPSRVADNCSRANPRKTQFAVRKTWFTEIWNESQKLFLPVEVWRKWIPLLAKLFVHVLITLIPSECMLNMPCERHERAWAIIAALELDCKVNILWLFYEFLERSQFGNFSQQLIHSIPPHYSGLLLSTAYS